jgi:MYXO-CTERM domain-containing protein
VRANEPEVLVFELTATANGLSSTDTVSITVQRSNRHPVARGPNDMEESERTPVTLSAAGSSDPDEDVLTYLWTQTAGPLVTLTGADSAELSFTTPDVLSDTVMTLRLVVRDGDGAESETTVRLTVKDINRAPTSRPSLAAGGIPGQRVTLDGSASADPDGDALTYEWKQVAGPTVALSAADKAVATFEAPITEKDTVTLAFELTVSDANGQTSTERLSVNIVPETSTGCGCSSSSGTGGMAPLLLLALGFIASRRRKDGQA